MSEPDFSEFEAHMDGECDRRTCFYCSGVSNADRQIRRAMTRKVRRNIVAAKKRIELKPQPEPKYMQRERKAFQGGWKYPMIHERWGHHHG